MWKNPQKLIAEAVLKSTLWRHEERNVVLFEKFGWFLFDREKNGVGSVKDVSSHSRVKGVNSHSRVGDVSTLYSLLSCHSSDLVLILGSASGNRSKWTPWEGKVCYYCRLPFFFLKQNFSGTFMINLNIPPLFFKVFKMCIHLLYF